MRRSILLLNTGSPDQPTTKSVRTYLGKFLMDPHVLDFPWIFRALLVYGIILPFRPKRSAEAYQKIWTPKGSPLTIYTHGLAKTLGIEVAMPYGRPSVAASVQKILNDGAEEICLLPLFPHDAMATTGSCIDEVKKEVRGRIPIRVIPPFFNHPLFIESLAKKVQLKADEHLLFSYHGLPLRHLTKGRSVNYQKDCLATSEAIAKAANLSTDQYSTSFQSRLGREKWIEPYTYETLQQLPAQGKKNVVVMTPSFFCDCLETLEEINISGQELFLESGGSSFTMIPCLNQSDEAIAFLQTVIPDAANWPLAE